VIGLIARCRVRSAIRALIGLMVYSFARIGVGLGGRWSSPCVAA
jgi:hypothetical protein